LEIGFFLLLLKQMSADFKGENRKKRVEEGDEK